MLHVLWEAKGVRSDSFPTLLSPGEILYQGMGKDLQARVTLNTIFTVPQFVVRGITVKITHNDSDIRQRIVSTFSKCLLEKRHC